MSPVAALQQLDVVFFLLGLPALFIENCNPYVYNVVNMSRHIIIQEGIVVMCTSTLDL